MKQIKSSINDGMKKIKENTIPVVWQNIMKNKLENYKRNCPNCGKKIIYKTKAGYTGGVTNNTNCSKCWNGGKNNPMYGKNHTKETREKIKVKRLNQIITEETKQKISQAHKGKIISEKTRKKMSEAFKGRVYGFRARNNMRISAIKRIENSIGQVKPNYNPASIQIIENKAKELGITDLQHAENGGEFYIKELGYWVDGYSKEKNIVIEYYEAQHKYQIEKDTSRKKDIERILKCKFVIIYEIIN